MSGTGSAWREVYSAVETEFGSQYAPLLDAARLAGTSVEFHDEPVDIETATQRIRLLLDMAKAAFQSHEHDLMDQLSIDRLDEDVVRLRPLSYAYHKRFQAALDARPVLKAGITEKFKTLREELSRDGRPHPVDSDHAPSKLGVCALVLDRKKGSPRILETVRAKHLAIYPGTRHASFSGGVEVRDISADDPSLSGVIARAAARECREELGVALEPSAVKVLGLWREMARCSVQSFAIAEVENLDALKIVPDRNEFDSWRVRPLRQNWLTSRLGKAKSAELEFLEMKLAAIWPT